MKPMTLMQEVQRTAERLYQVDMGVNFERFVVDQETMPLLSEHINSEEEALTRFACLYFVPDEERLNLAIYFSPEVLGALERCDPRSEINDENILPFMAMIEELTHAMHLTLLFIEDAGSITTEATLRALEVQAKVDTYVILHIFLLRLKREKESEWPEKLWLRYNVFEREDFRYAGAALEKRYLEARELGLAFSIFLDSLDSSEWRRELQHLRRLPYPAKQRYIHAVAGSGVTLAGLAA